MSAVQAVHSPSLYVVVVIYNSTLNKSSTCRSLLRQQAMDLSSRILVYDNSSQSALGNVPAGWEVFLDPSNGGLYSAYTYALSRAQENNVDWLLLLDQDTELPDDFVAHVVLDSMSTDLDRSVAAIVPTVFAACRQISPLLTRLGRETPIRRSQVVEKRWITAINSGACLRVDFVAGIGGFSPLFPLDYLDHWLFLAINRKGRSVFISGAVLQHNLSVANMNGGVSVARYQNVLDSERRFINMFLPRLWAWALFFRLLARGCKHLLLTRDKRLGALMFNAAISQISSLVCGLSKD